MNSFLQLNNGPLWMRLIKVATAFALELLLIRFLAPVSPAAVFYWRSKLFWLVISAQAVLATALVALWVVDWVWDRNHSF